MAATTKVFDSAAIKSASYDRATKALNITFTSGNRYTYSDCDEKLFRGLCRAKSAGRYFAKNIRPHYVTA